MTLLMRDQENLEKGMEKGKSVGEEMMLICWGFGLSDAEILETVRKVSFVI